MLDRLAVVVLGARDSGKTTTWKHLFGHHVKTGKKPRKLWFHSSEWAEVFLVSGSAQERGMRIGQIVKKPFPRILLCSVQYKHDAHETFAFLQHSGYTLCVTRLNPGYKEDPAPDAFGLAQSLTEQGATFRVRSGNADPAIRAQEMLEFIYGWARSRSLVQSDADKPPLITLQRP